MKLLSYNIRGAGSVIKKKEVSTLIRKFDIDICFLQETKLENVSEVDARSLWGENRCGWAAKESMGRSGGLITLWNDEKFVCSSQWHMAGAVVINGFWSRERLNCCIINVYGLKSIEERADLWDRIRTVTDQNNDLCVCVVGDFNSVRCSSERRGSSDAVCRKEIEDFDGFIEEAKLIDLPLHGRRFTWYKPNGQCKSRLDRMLINEEWGLKWPETFTKIGLGPLPSYFGDKINGLGSETFPVYQRLAFSPRTQNVCGESVERVQNRRVGGYVLKEKFKLLKEDLKKIDELNDKIQ